MKKTLYICTLLLTFSTCFSQLEYHNWVFGRGCYITFDSPSRDPEFVERLNVSVFENTSVISNSVGDLQFYSFDKFLYNSNDELVSDRIDGHYSSIQGSCMFRVNDNHYVRVGSSYAAEEMPSESTLSHFDIYTNVNNETVSQRKIIDSSSSSEGLQIIKNHYSNEVFLIVPDTNNNRSYINLFKYKNGSFQLDQKFELDSGLKLQYIKYSPFNGLIAALETKDLQYVHFFRFNKNTSKIEKLTTNSIIKPSFSVGYFEFSPNGNYLYVKGLFSFYRIDGLNKIETTKPTITDLTEEYNSLIGVNLQLGPNKKIYSTIQGRNYLSSIENPDSPTELTVIRESVYLEDTKSDIGLPNIPTSFYDFYDFKDSIVVCLGEDILLESNMNFEYDDTTYVWSGPNGFTSDLRNPIIENSDIDDAGTYSVVVHNSDSSISYEREVVVTIETDIKNPKIVVSPDSIVCNTDEVKIVVVNTYENFEWSTGETTREIKVRESGKYSIEYTNDNGCVGYTEVNISFGEDITTDIIGPTLICEGSEEIYSADRDYETYKWSNGDDTKTTLISEAGKYWLEVTTAEGCTISDTIDISYHPEITAELKPVSTTICEGDSVLLESKYDAPYFDYLWSTDATTKSIYASETGTYKLTITDTRTGCIDSTEVAISVEDNLQPTVIGSDICEGETATLEALPNDPSYSYEWSNGETTPTIVVSQPATYTVTVSKDGCSGTAEFTVNESPNPEFEIFGEDIVCGNTAMLSCSEDYAEYLWSTDEITKEIEVTEAGTYTLTVTYENGCSSTQEYTVNEQSLSFDISKDRIDFGKVYISETSRDSVEIVNRSGIELTITDGTKNYIIPDGFPVKYTKTLEPTELGPYTDSFEYRVISPCDTVITIPVTAEVYAKVEISTKEETETEIGAEVSIPVYLQAEADLSEQTYTITTDIDKTVLFTEDEFTITQTAPINKAKTQIHEISGMIMLASELEYDITFPNYEFNNPYIEVIDRPGKILIDSVCAFPLRNVTFLESTEMKVSPNPAKDRLVVDIFIDIPSDIELVEMEDENKASRFDRLSDQRVQQMQLELISSEGRIACTENWTQTSTEKQISINTDKIPSGLYQVRLQTPSGVLTENVIVVR